MPVTAQEFQSLSCGTCNEDRGQSPILSPRRSACSRLHHPERNHQRVFQCKRQPCRERDNSQ